MPHLKAVGHIYSELMGVVLMSQTVEHVMYYLNLQWT